MLYAYFGGLGADKQATYELALEQLSSGYLLTATHSAHGGAPQAPSAWGWLRHAAGAPAPRRLYAGPELRRALLILLDAASAASRAALGQRYCYVLPTVPSQAGALAALVPQQLRHDSSLPLHPQLWQAGRPLDTLPLLRHGQAVDARGHAWAPAEGEPARRTPLSR